MLWLALTPNILFTFATVIIATRFKMTEQTMADVRMKLDERRRLGPTAAGAMRAADSRVDD